MRMGVSVGGGEGCGGDLEQAPPTVSTWLNAPNTYTCRGSDRVGRGGMGGEMSYCRGKGKRVVVG